ncbi:hypothetical protein ACFY3B_19310 [Micromonospora parva]|uniref:ATP-binding protein n=1 Tax=Micromonospora parva TaxID=1464048 RepID=A0ABW6VZ42_9ACTN
MSDSPDEERSKPKEPPQGAKLRGIADLYFETFRAPDGRMYGISRDMPGRALRHGKPSELVQDICRTYLDVHGGWPNSSAQAEVSSYLEAVTREVRPVPVRCHWKDGRLLLDVGDANWTVLVVDGDGVRELVGPAPLAFRRGSGAAMPWPLPSSGDLALLWKLVPVTEADRPVVLALLIVAWMTGVPQPIVLLTGPQDSGKTTTAQFLLSLVDPVAHQRGGSLPEREDEWKTRVAQARVVFVDNSGHITPKVSDLLCRVATGGELTTRELYTNDGAHVSDLLVPVWLTSIDSGVLRGDLQSRIVPVELESLTVEQRRTMSKLSREQNEARPTIVRALLELTAGVIRLLPTVDDSRLVHRMTDFNLVLRCVDQILNTQGEARLIEQSQDLAGDVLDADHVALALMKLLGRPDGYGSQVAGPSLAQGMPAEELLRLLNQVASFDGKGDGWPRTPKVLSGRLRAIAPALEQARGVRVEFTKSNGRKLVRVVQS